MHGLDADGGWLLLLARLAYEYSSALKLVARAGTHMVVVKTLERCVVRTSTASNDALGAPLQRLLSPFGRLIIDKHPPVRTTPAKMNFSVRPALSDVPAYLDLTSRLLLEATPIIIDHFQGSKVVGLKVTTHHSEVL